jgi:hypothetical protein
MRTIMAFATHGDGMTLALDLAPVNVPDQGVSFPVVVPNGAEEGIEAVGGSLAALLTNHPAVKGALTAALAANVDAPPSPLYFDVRAPAADALLWEALFVGPPVGFCALDHRWPIGRIASVRRELDVRVFVPPLRIVAVLAANGRRGLPQFKALLAAVSATRPDGTVPVTLHVIVSEDEVFDAATAAAAADGRVSVERIAGSEPAIARQIAAALPHVLHVLSHGGTSGGVWSLFLATPGDDRPDADPMHRGSVTLRAATLTRALQPSNPWLVVLSACATAAVPGDGPALANELASSGVPAVVGMRRMVDLTAMNRFCAEFYPQVLALVDGQLSLGRGASVDWAAALTDPRTVLSDGNPCATDAWTDPVLYAQNQPLQVVMTQVPASRAPAAPPDVITLAERQGELARWRSFLSTLDASTPQDVVDEVRTMIAKLEAALGGAA